MACDDFLLTPTAAVQRRRTLRQSPWIYLLSLLRCWQARAGERRQLARMGSLGRYDAVWRDLGLSDVDLRREIAKPFWRR